MARASVRTRILATLFLTILAFGGVLVGTLAAMHEGGVELETVASNTVPLSRLIARAQETSLPPFQPRRLLTEDRALRIYSDALERATRRMNETLAAADDILKEPRPSSRGRSTFSLTSLRREMALVQAHWDRLREALIQGSQEIKSTRALAPGPVREQREQALAGRMIALQRYEAEYRTRLQELSALLDRRITGAVGRAQSLQRQSTTWVTGLGILAALVSMLGFFWTSRALAPLGRLLEQVRALTRGAPEARVPMGGAGELATVSEELAQAARTIAEREERLRRAERLAAVGEVSAQITHEIRNPLNALAMNLELLAEEPEGEDAGEIWTSVRSEIERLTNITENYLQLSRLPQGQMEPVRVDALLADLQTLLGAEMATRGVVYSATVPPALPCILGDAEQLHRALLNLMRNALDAMHDGGRLSACIEAGSSTLKLNLTDTGSGIAPEDLSRIFDPFFTRKAGGTGLGLAITDRIVADHGGQLSVDSSPTGTTVTVSLPIPEMER